MKKFYVLSSKLFFAILLFVVFILSCKIGLGQTTIASQDFEVTPATPTLTFANTNGSNSTGTNGAAGVPSTSL